MTPTDIQVPNVQAILHLLEPRSWNDIAAEYGVSPEVLVRMNGNSVGIGSLIYIPTPDQDKKIRHYLLGHDIEESVYVLPFDSTLAQIAIDQQIPTELLEMFQEMNLASPNETKIDAIRDIHTPIQKG